MQDNQQLSDIDGDGMYQEIYEYLDYFKNVVLEKCVAFLFNDYNATDITDDYNRFSVFAEYLDTNESELIINSLFRNGIRVISYCSEHDFIMAMSTEPEKKSSMIVLNSIQSGTRIGRKSLIPAFCDLLDIAYTGSNAYVVSLCRNKYHSGCILSKHDIIQPTSWLYSKDSEFEGVVPPKSIKLIVKPNCEASSIGIDKNNIGYFDARLKRIIEEMSYDLRQDIIIQQFIEGYEVEVPVVYIDRPIALEPIGIQLGDDCKMSDRILSYDIRFNDSYEYFLFSDIDPGLSAQLQKTAEKAARILGIRGFGRIDFRVNDNGMAFITDIATNPHITNKSSFAYAFNKVGCSYPDMLICLLGSAFRK